MKPSIKLLLFRLKLFLRGKLKPEFPFYTVKRSDLLTDELYGRLHDSDGRDSVVIYISSIKAMKRLPNNYNICINQEIVNNLTNFLGENNVKVVEKSIEKRA